MTYVRGFSRGLALVASALLAGCAGLHAYRVPTDAPTARVRLIGNQPVLHTDPVDGRRGTDGFAYYGDKRRTLGMPTDAASDAAYSEYRVVAGQPLKVTFADPQVIPAKGTAMAPYRGSTHCAHDSVTFTPKPGHDYVLRESGAGRCRATVTEWVTAAGGSAHEVLLATGTFDD